MIWVAVLVLDAFEVLLLFPQVGDPRLVPAGLLWWFHLLLLTFLFYDFIYINKIIRSS